MIFPLGKFVSHSCLIVTILCLFYGIFLSENGVNASTQDNMVAEWAETFGKELYDLARNMTKSDEIQKKYREYNAAVVEADGQKLIDSVSENVGRMLARKMDAVKCILKAAEKAYEEFEEDETKNFTYYSSKLSADEFGSAFERAEHPSWEENQGMYRPLNLNKDTHFYDMSVNTNYSSVQVPSNIYDKSRTVLEAIKWTEALDEVFVQNYGIDPALSWQYFGSQTGILRHYPALKWESDDPDVYDCRKRSWYIETATCSKDVVILLDSSGSMYGFRNYIAQLTIRSLMDTFSNNDFFNIITYSETSKFLIDCFAERLVQATPENINQFNRALKNVTTEDHANVTSAYEKAFELLEKYREMRRCNESATGCNQAIMLVTDGVAGNTTEIFETYNRYMVGNTTKIPVRVFTYLLGKEVTKVREIQWMACLNRGYYSHIQTLDEVAEEVLKYVDVIACPLVLQGVEHPPTWTHAFADEISFFPKTEDKSPRLMFSVGVPAFDRKALQGIDGNNSTRRARLLGIAGTDIPLEDIDDLTLPYKLGVNGYPFIVSNNGYVMLHPDLRPMENTLLKENYNSIDLTEVEQLLEDENPRHPGKKLLDIRNSIVNHEKNFTLNVMVKYHYDKMRRVSNELQDYYWAPLPNTPFSLGLVLPSKYGKYWIDIPDEIQYNRILGINISNYFIGENWKVHPDWDYCKYHYLEGHEFDTPEDGVRHFLVRLGDPDWKWSEQYEIDPEESSADDSNGPNCGRKSLSDDAYYCNKELFELLIFDAKVTNKSYQTWEYPSKEVQKLIGLYKANLRFVATVSGLTRWQFINESEDLEVDKEFGDFHKTAIDETWYKSAVLQHFIDPDSFVYSVPHTLEEREGDELKVSASSAIFARDFKRSFPASVVGFQFSHDRFAKRFFEITSKSNCKDCNYTCSSDEYLCYLIDNNGYVIVSENSNDTGFFFGELQGAVMESMVHLDIFKSYEVYDLQGLCSRQELDTSDANLLLTPFKIFQFGLNWLLTELFWFLSRINFWAEGFSFYDNIAEDYNSDYEIHTFSSAPAKKKPRKGQPMDEEEYFNRPKEIKYQEVFYPCDKKAVLHVLEQELFISKKDSNEVKQTGSARPYYVKRIPFSNMILVVINTSSLHTHKFITASPQVVHYGDEYICHKLGLSDLFRRRLDECYTEHPDEAEYTYCGDASSIELKKSTILLSAITIVMVTYLRFVLF